MVDTAEEEEEPHVGRVVEEEEEEDVMGEAAMALERTVRSELDTVGVSEGPPVVEESELSMEDTAVREFDARFAAAAARVLSLALEAKAVEAEEDRVTRALEACWRVLDVKVVPPLPLPLLVLLLLKPAVKLCASAL